MRKLTYILLFSNILLISCNKLTQKEYGHLDLKFVRDKYLEIAPGQLARLHHPRLIYENDSSILFTIDEQKAIIYKYDFNTGKLLEKLDITQKPDFQALYNKKKRKFHINYWDYINKDSIFIRFHLLYFNLKERADSTLMLIDWQGNIKNYYSFQDVPIPATENGFVERDTASYFATTAGNLAYCKNVRALCLPMQRWINTVPGDSLWETKRTTVGGHLDLNYPFGKYVKHNLYFPPMVHLNGYYPRNYIAPSFLLHDEKILYGFRYTDKVFLYNIKTNVIEKQGNIGSYLFDSVPPTKIPYGYYDNPKLTYKKDFPSEDHHLPRYNDIYYNPHQGYYYRIIQHACRRNASPAELNNLQYTLSVVDTNFNKIAEGMLPTDLVRYGLAVPIFTPEGVYIWNKEKTQAYDNQIVLSFFKLNFEKRKNTPTLLQKLIDNERKQLSLDASPGLYKYIEKKFNISGTENIGVLMLPVENSCHSCMESIYRYFADSSTWLANKPIKLLLIGSTTQVIDASIEKQTHFHTQMPSLKNNIWRDDKNEAFKYVPQWINPRWVVFENGKITKDQRLNPDQIPQFPEYVKEFIWKSKK